MLITVPNKNQNVHWKPWSDSTCCSATSITLTVTRQTQLFIKAGNPAASFALQ
jgi:hypothetical protein